jgi:hypothetical protein
MDVASRATDADSLAIEARTEEEAKRFIDKLRFKNGGLTEEDKDFLRSTRPHILETLEEVREQLGGSTKRYVSAIYLLFDP